MLATKSNPYDYSLKNELRYMLLDFQENAEGKFVAGFKKPRNFIDGYCQTNSTGSSVMHTIGVQDKRTYEWIYTPEAKEFFQCSNGTV